MMEVADHPMVGVCWNSNSEDVQKGSVQRSFELLKSRLRKAHIHELWTRDYPWRELFRLMKESGAEIPESPG
jgi:type IV secretory pathway VirD2 relaxase